MIHSTKTSTPTFPAWIWSDLCDKWVHYPSLQGYWGPPPRGWHTHWHADQPEPPAEIPADSALARGTV